MIPILLSVTSIGLFITVVLKYFYWPYPWMYVWIPFYTSVHLLYLCLRTNNRIFRIVLSNLLIFLFCLGSLEALASMIRPPLEKFDTFYTHLVKDPVLGYAPEKDKRLHSSRNIGDKKIYEATYTIDKTGLRVTPKFNSPLDRESILFFGCSNMFGTGLEDYESLPHIVGSLSGMNVYNFAFVGYGPHQMLSAIEHGIVDKTITQNPKYAIYGGALFQVDRVVGRPLWTYRDPQYILSAKGTLKYQGHFDDSPCRFLIKKFLERSAIYRGFFEHRYYLTRRDVELFTAIIIKSKRELMKRYPDMEFHVLYWITRRGLTRTIDELILDRFQKEGIVVHNVEKILPDFFEEGLKYQISTNDPHPSFLANRMLADYVVKNILKKPLPENTAV